MLPFRLLLVAGVLGLSAPVGAAGKAEEKGPGGEKLNACGCYRDNAGNCRCTKKKAKCVCSGDCEPIGCEEKRQKEMEKEAQAELKRIKEQEKKKEAEDRKRAKDEEKRAAREDKPE